MSNPYLAEIRIFGGNFAIRGWAFCNGQLIAISQNTALFSLLGTQFGGNGTSNFGLPNFQGSAPVGMGQGSGLSNYVMGESGGTSSVTVINVEMPQHTHTPLGLPSVPDPTPQTSPSGNIWAVAGSRRGTTNLYASTPGTPVQMNAGIFGAVGGSQPHNNLHPYLTLTFLIALQGVFPARV